MRNSQARKDMLAERRNEQRNRIGGFYAVPRSPLNQLRTKRSFASRQFGASNPACTKAHTAGRHYA